MKKLLSDTNNNIWIVVTIACWISLFIGSEVEGKLLPAATPMELIRFVSTDARYPDEYTEDGNEGRNTAFWIRSKRLRPACGPVKLEWFLGERNSTGRSGAVINAVWGAPKNRPDGVTFTAGPWIAHVSKDQFLNTYSDVMHTCNILGIKHEVRTPFFN